MQSVLLIVIAKLLYHPRQLVEDHQFTHKSCAESEG